MCMCAYPISTRWRVFKYKWICLRGAGCPVDFLPHVLYGVFYNKHTLFMQSGNTSKVILQLEKNKATVRFHSSVWVEERGLWLCQSLLEETSGQEVRTEGRSVLCEPCLLPHSSEGLSEPGALQTQVTDAQIPENTEK